MNKELRQFVEKEIVKGKYRPGAVIVKRLFDSQADALYLLRTYLIWTKNHTHPFGRRIHRIQLERKYGIYCGGNVVIGLGLCLPHPTGIVIGKGTIIGENATIYQQVTFGGKEIHKSIQSDSYPCIGNNCVFYKGSTIVGPVKVADNTIVGANAFLNHDTVPGTYGGIPAKMISEGTRCQEHETQ